MVGIVAVWRCKCGLRVKVVAEADTNQPPSREVVASCPKCGEARILHAEKILSVTELIDLAFSATA
jgi:hypothetical protein